MIYDNDMSININPILFVKIINKKLVVIGLEKISKVNAFRLSYNLENIEVVLNDLSLGMAYFNTVSFSGKN